MEWQLQDKNTGEWISLDNIPGVVPSAALYDRAVLLNNTEIIIKLISLQGQIAGKYYWSVGM